MSNPTSNYGWQMPTSSDLVTDLPADFEVFGQAVDTTTKALNPSTTLGDIEYRSSTSNTNTRLAIGSSGQVLTVSGGVPAWATPASGDITGVTATSPLTGGGTSGDVSIGVDMAAVTKLTLNAQTGTTYTFVLADADNKLVTASNASAQTYTIPPNASVAFPTGTQINIIQIGAGQVTFSQGAGVTIASNGGTATAPKLRVQYSAATAIKVDTNTWYVVGDIS